jgi:hypothetical protein
VQLRDVRRLNRCIALKQDAQLALVAQRVLRCGDRRWPADRNRCDEAREKHHVAHRQDSQHIFGQHRLDGFGRALRLCL